MGLCNHVLRLSCPSRSLDFTGFRAEVDGEVGVITALHAVIGCPSGGIAEERSGFDSDLRVTRVDLLNDLAFLSGKGLGRGSLDLARGLPDGPLRVVGYPLGARGQFAIYLDLIHPRSLRLASVGMPDDIRRALRDRQSPSLQADVLPFVGELSPGHSGAPILSEDGRVVAIGNGGLKSAESDIVWAIPAWDIEWSGRVSEARRALEGEPTAGLAAFGSNVTFPELPPLFLVDGLDRVGPVYRHDSSGVSIAYTWGHDINIRGHSDISSIATDGHGRIVFTNANRGEIYEYKDGRVVLIHTHSDYSRSVKFDWQRRLYFSQSRGSAENGRIYRLWEERVELQMEVELKDVGGRWTGDFAFAPDNTIWLSSGNQIPAYLFEVSDGRPQLRYEVPHPIMGFVFLDENNIVYTDHRQEARTLHLPTMTEGEVIRLGSAQHLSDVAVAP